MTDGGTKAMVELLRHKLLNLNGTIAAVGFLALIIGFFIDSLVGRIICGLIVVGAAGYLYRAWRNHRRDVKGGAELKEEAYSQSPEGAMKKLLFDDFQSSGGTYVVKEVEDEAEHVVPSTKTAQPAALSLRPETVRELEILDFFDLDSDRAYSETDPKSEFHSLVNKVLLVLKDALFAHSVAFFWANREKQQMVLESMATESKGFMSGRRFPIENDLISQVGTTGKPQLVGTVNPVSEKELLRYYEVPANVRSVLGVPVFYMDKAKDILPVGVIVADSMAEDAFGAETLTLMGRFTRLVSALIKSYTDKYDLLLDSELLTSIRRMQDRIKSDASEHTILAALIEEMNRLANWDYLTVVMFSDEKHGWVVQKVVNKVGQPYVAPDHFVEVNDSIVGKVIRTNAVEVIDDLGARSAPRFSASERVESQGSFACVPISSYNRCYGAIALESKDASNFNGNEVETIYRLVENAAASLEVVYMNDLLKDFVAVDHLTGAMTKKYFLRKVEEEVQRADDFGTDLSLVFLSVDGMQEHAIRYGKDGADAILVELAKLIRGNIRPYDLLGRQVEDRLGVVLIQTAANDGYLWAEKIRKLVASHVIAVGAKSFSVTVSIGVCGLTEGMRVAELATGATQVLGKAIENGGNLVRVF